MIHLANLLVPLIMLSHNYQNHDNGLMGPCSLHPRRRRSRPPSRRAAQRLLLRILKHAKGLCTGKGRRGLPPLLAAVGGTRGVEAVVFVKVPQLF
jgi:hypothetical protein